MNAKASTFCGSCGFALCEESSAHPSARVPCPRCGSASRSFNVEIAERVTVREKIELKHKRPGFKKPIYEEVSGDDLHRKTGLWSRILRVIDRASNRYREEIVNSETGEVLRSVDEALTSHVGRGSAKKPEGDRNA